MKNQLTTLLSLLFTVLIISAAVPACGQNRHDSLEITAAIRNYVDAIYEKDTSRIYTSVDPVLAKRGYSRRDGKWTESTMSFKQLVQIAATWRRSERKLLVPEITIFDILDHTASAKLKADWGIDYFHLSKSSGSWKIYNVMWQSHPVIHKQN
jgi:hypothetical protein